MSQLLEGTYEFVSEDNYLEYLKSLGLGDEVATKMASIKTPLVISEVTANSVAANYGGKQITFPLDKEVEHTPATGQVVKTTASINGDVATFKTVHANGLTEERVLKFTSSGVTSTTINSKGIKAVRQYKRV